MDNFIPFPQADDFEKIVFILNISNEEDLNNIFKMKVLLGNISDRQVSYYLSAASFLGLLVTTNGKKYFSLYATRLRKQNSYMQIAELISLVLQNPIFNKVYIFSILFGKQEVEDVATIIKTYYPLYSDAICFRRSQTVLSWVKWIVEKFTN